MNLLTFSQQPIRPDPASNPAAETPASPADRFPLTITYPADAPIAVPATWRRLPTGQIEATYHDYNELYWSVTISKWFHDWAAEPPRPPGQATPGQATPGQATPGQASLPLIAPSSQSTYYRKG